MSAAREPGFLRRNARCLVALIVVAPLYAAARLPAPSAAERAELAGRFRFTRAELPELSRRPARSIRAVHPSLAKIAGWISVIGAAAALDDLDGDGLANDVCWVDARTDEVFVAPAPGSGARYAPFVLEPDLAGHDRASTAPMGCVPADMDEDGRVDVLVTYWGRTPVAFLRRKGAAGAALGAGAFHALDVAPGGERWYTNAATFADVDGDGHADLVVGNYFADGARILDAAADPEDPGYEPQHMQDSMTRAYNGGRNRVLLWEGGAPRAASARPTGSEPHVAYREAEGALPAPYDEAWTLAVAAADLDGDLLPELYFANDFAPDLLLHNRSRPGHVELARLEGERTWTKPASKVLGRDSFKGMGADFGDVDRDGTLDIYVSNITTEYGLEESQFLWLGTGESARMAAGVAPFSDESEALGLSRSGWAWDAKLADLDNDGTLEALQALGFLRGATNRWPELHEIAMGNDTLLHDPAAWHRFGPGDDLSGGRGNAFFARAAGGRYTDVAAELGLGAPENTRGIALGDADGDLDLDLVFANQWQGSAFLRNDAPRPGPHAGAALALRLMLPLEPQEETRVLDGSARDLAARPAATAALRVSVAGEPARPPFVAQLERGNGHAGARSHELVIGLGALGSTARLSVELAWRDAAGIVRRETLALAPGRHTLVLASALGRPGGRPPEGRQP